MSPPNSNFSPKYHGLFLELLLHQERIPYFILNTENSPRATVFGAPNLLCCQSWQIVCGFGGRGKNRSENARGFK
jgi:hypothetical protein